MGSDVRQIQEAMIYTAICGDIDEPRTDVKCFADMGSFTDSRMAAKKYKILSNLLFQEPTVWLDGNITSIWTEEQLISNFLGDADIALFKHPYRTNVADECRVCQKWKKETKEKLKEFQDHHGDRLKSLPLYECGVLIRRHNPTVAKFNQIWWDLINRWSARDQLTCALAIKESGVKVNVIHGNLRKSPVFTYSEHNKPKADYNVPTP